jgi:hypothetical protein
MKGDTDKKWFCDFVYLTLSFKLTSSDFCLPTQSTQPTGRQAAGRSFVFTHPSLT